MGATGDITLTINPLTNPLVAGDAIQFTLPEYWDLTQLARCSVEQPPRKFVTTGATPTITSLTTKIVLTGPLAVTTDDIVVTCQGAKNPNVTQPTVSTVIITSIHRTAGSVIDETTTGLLPAILPGLYAQILE